MTQHTQHPRPARGQLWLLIALFFAPLLVAFVLYYFGDGWRPSGTTNHGDLVEPAIELPDVTFTSVSEEPVEASTWRGKWSLVYVDGEPCAERCRELLTLTRQTRLALNDDMPRVRRVLLTSGECCEPDYLRAEHPDLIVASLTQDGGQALRESFERAVPGGAIDGRIYIVDPHGVLMMSYAAEAPARGLLDDLKKLLKLSRIG